MTKPKTTLLTLEELNKVAIGYPQPRKPDPKVKALSTTDRRLHIPSHHHSQWPRTNEGLSAPSPK